MPAFSLFSLLPLPTYLGQDDAAGYRDIEGFHSAGRWNANQFMAPFANRLAEPLLFTSKDKYHRPFPVKVIMKGARFSGSADDPETNFGEFIQCATEIGDFSDGKLKVGPGGTLKYSSGDFR